MARSIRRRIDVCALDLSGWVVATEAATGAYASTAAAAAAAGAEVWALAAESLYGTAANAMHDVTTLCDALGLAHESVTFAVSKDELPYERIDLITNSGVLRPISADMIERLSGTAAIALMYEAWEARDGDIDYAAAAEHGVKVIEVDEHHPACGAFEFVGDLVIAAALRRRWPIRAMLVGVVSDNPFAAPVVAALESMGADAVVIDPTAWGADAAPMCDLVVVAATPPSSGRAWGASPDPTVLEELVIESGAFGCIQLWGDLDTDRLRAAGVQIEPEIAPLPGHQGIAMTDAGFEAVVRLQVAGMAAVLHGPDGAGSLSGLGQELAWSAP